MKKIKRKAEVILSRYPRGTRAKQPWTLNICIIKYPDDKKETRINIKLTDKDICELLKTDMVDKMDSFEALIEIEK